MSTPTPRDIICGDCLDVMRGWPDGCVDAVITDIPYGEVNRVSGGLRCLDKGDADVCNLNLTELAAELVRLVRGSIYVFCGVEQVSELRAALVDIGLTTRLCIWHKTNPSPMNGEHLWLSSIECCVFARKSGAVFNEHCASCVWDNPSGQRTQHPTQKPLELMRRIISASTNERDLVLDPFAGSGSTLVAAERLGRRWVGIELNPEYCEIARKRTAQRSLFTDS
jgi:DNA modification methylase